MPRRNSGDPNKDGGISAGRRRTSERRGSERKKSSRHKSQKRARDERHSYAVGDFRKTSDRSSQEVPRRRRGRRSLEEQLTELQTFPPVVANSAGFKLSDFRDDQGQSLLGNGCFGTVRKIVHKATGQVMALKVVPKSLIKKHNLIKQMRREIQIHATVDHPHIVKHKFHLEDDENYYLGLEYATGGGLFKRLRAARTFAPALASKYIYQVLLAVSFLHSHGIIHRDLKPENLLLFKSDHDEFIIKLSDFGWSNESLSDKQGRQTFCGTLEYLAPEMVQGHSHDTSLDMWSVGVLLYEFLCGVAPFTGNAAQDVFSKIVQGRVRFPGGLDVDAVNLVMRLLRREPAERLTAAEALEHPFITKFNGAKRQVTNGSMEREESSESIRQLRARVAELDSLLEGKRQRVNDLAKENSRLRKENSVLEGRSRKLAHIEDNVLNPLASVLIRASASGRDTCGIEEFVELAAELEERLVEFRRKACDLESDNLKLVASLSEARTSRSSHRDESERLRALVQNLQAELDAQPARLDDIEQRYLDEIDKLKVLLRSRTNGSFTNGSYRATRAVNEESSVGSSVEPDDVAEAMRRHMNLTVEVIQPAHDAEQTNKKLRRENDRLSISLAQTQSNLLEEKQRVAKFRSNSKNRRTRLADSVLGLSTSVRRTPMDSDTASSSGSTIRDLDSSHQHYLDRIRRPDHASAESSLARAL